MKTIIKYTDPRNAIVGLARVKKVMPVTLLIGMLLIGCNTAQESSFIVTHHGVLKEIMMEQKLHSRIALSGFEDTPHFYALGAMEGLKGEVLIWDGKPLNGIAKSGELLLDKSFSQNAALLVSSQVEAWHTEEVNWESSDLGSFQSKIQSRAENAGLNTQEAFPFLIEATIKKLDWHIINAAEATEQNHEAFKAAGLKGTVQNESVKILGFYSENHQGVFTHHGSFLHMHFVNDDESVMGHVDGLEISGRIKLMLPKIEK